MCLRVVVYTREYWSFVIHHVVCLTGIVYDPNVISQGAYSDNLFLYIMQLFSETFKELTQLYRAKALRRVKLNNEKEVPQMIMVCNYNNIVSVGFLIFCGMQ